MSTPEHFYVFLFVIFLFTIPVVDGNTETLVDGETSIVIENIQLTHASNQASPSWGPDGNKIVYSSNKEIWMMNYSGSGKKMVYESIVWDGEPCFNHNGSFIYFASEHVKPFSPEYINIHRINSDGTGREQLTSDADQRAPDVSPDGSSIVYLSKISGNYDVWIMNTNGSNNRRLTEDPGNEGNPSWHPDSSKIIYSSNGDLWLINRNGTDKKQLTNDEFDNIDPVFSHDGEWIAFSSNRNGNYDIWAMKPESSIIQLTSINSTQKEPSWSPNNNKLVYTSNEDGNYNIWLMKLDISEFESSGNEEVPTVTSNDNIYNNSKNFVTNNFFIVAIAGIIGMVILMIFFFKKVIKNL